MKVTVWSMTPPVRSVSQAFAILRLLATDSGPMTLSEVARAQGLSPSSCLNLLRALVGEGALIRDEPTRSYRLAPAWASAGVLDDGAARVIAHWQPLLTRFATEHDAAVGLWQQVGEARLGLVALAESGAATRIHMARGQRQPVGGGATGRALAAANDLPAAVLRRRFDAVRWQRALTFPEWLGQVEAAREAGFAIDDGYGHAGICSIGAVVGSRGNAPRFCLSATIFAGSRSADQVTAIGRALASLAESGAGSGPG